MRVALLSKTYVSQMAQRQLEVLAQRPGMDLTLITPPRWHMDDGRVWPFQPTFTQGYDVVQVPLLFNGQHHLYAYRGLGRVLRELRPDLVHIDEEPYNLVGYQAQWLAAQMGIPTVFNALQSQYRRYPPPYAWVERFNYDHTAHIIAGNTDVDEVLRRKGYRGASSVFYVYGVDPQLYAPQPRAVRKDSALVVGYYGRLLFDKGLGVLIQALAALPKRYCLRLAGSGPDRAKLTALATARGVADRVEFLPPVPTVAIPAALAQLDIFALPSLTRPHWKEQFSRVLMEAMACGLPVVASDSGENPRALGDAGLIAREGDVQAWAEALRTLGEDGALRAHYAQAARDRVLAHYTLEHVTAHFAAVYATVLGARQADQAVAPPACVE